MIKTNAIFKSRVLDVSAAPPYTALAHFTDKLSLETDPSDVYFDLQNGETGFMVLDARSPKAFAEAHIPGTINLPHRMINKDSTANLPKDKLIVTYCFSPACNASTKAAVKLVQLGFRVKEMIGGIEYWQKEGYPVATAQKPDVRLEAKVLG